MLVGGDPAGFWADRDTEVVIQRIKGYIGYAPNISEEIISAGTLESWAAYLAILKVDKEQAVDGAAQMDPFNEPDRPYLWRESDKDAVLVSAAGGVGSVTFSLRPSGVGRIWRINMKLNVKLSRRETLNLLVNYTDDGNYNNASFWFQIWSWVRY